MPEPLTARLAVLGLADTSPASLVDASAALDSAVRADLASLTKTVSASSSWTPQAVIQAHLPRLTELAADSGPDHAAATRLLVALAQHLPPALAPALVASLHPLLDDSSLRFRAHIALLAALEALVNADSSDPSFLAPVLHPLLPSLLPFLRHSRPQLVSHAKTATSALISHALRRTAPDLLPRVSLVVDALANPDVHLQAALAALASHVWTRDVDAPTLALVYPIISRALSKSRSPDILRLALNLSSNLFKLITSSRLVHSFAFPLLPHIDSIADTAAYPETRTLADECRKLLRSALPLDNTPFPGTVTADGQPSFPYPVSDQFDHTAASLARQRLAHLSSLAAKLDPPDLQQKYQAVRNTVIEALVQALCTLAAARVFDTKTWHSVYVAPALTSLDCPASASSQDDGDDNHSAQLTTYLCDLFLDADSSRQQLLNKASSSDADALVDLPFSLAYGGLLLLNHTRLYLLPGARYGVCGKNGAGKSTLLNAIKNRRIDGFPTNIRTAHVEHNLDGEESDDLTPLKYLTGTVKVDESVAISALRETGFSPDPNAAPDAPAYPDRTHVPVSSLSGGWKMRLALASAIASNAELLLLDEPTNHLDRASIEWLQSWLVSRSDLSCMIVSHDSGFLDAVCTHIIHYEEKRLVYYEGNLAKFVEKVPSARSYYTLSASVLKFSFPPPGALSGVRSQTRAILKMAGVTYTYPGAPKPSLHNATCAVSLSSRVGIVGPNGAGKSTLIKVLTGEVLPDTGFVNKHPNLRVALMHQHAFEHIEQHLEKSAAQYIKWRYQDGHDRELASKASRRLTPEEKKLLDQPVVAQTGEKRFIESIIGRQKLKKSFTYEIKWKGMDHRSNTWIPRERLLELGFAKIVGQFDDFEASREGSGTRELSSAAVMEHLAQVGLEGDIAEHNELRSLSGGQKVKVVLAAAMWAKPQILILDEPTNFLDRDALGGLAVAIRDWAGAFVCISHNEEFISALCPEIWHVDNGILTQKGKVAIVEDAFDDSFSSLPPSIVASRATSKTNTPSASAANSDAAATNDPNHPPMPVVKKKKLTRKQLKEREERRRLRKVAFLSNSLPGATLEPDTESD